MSCFNFNRIHTSSFGHWSQRHNVDLTAFTLTPLVIGHKAQCRPHSIHTNSFDDWSQSPMSTSQHSHQLLWPLVTKPNVDLTAFTPCPASRRNSRKKETRHFEDFGLLWCTFHTDSFHLYFQTCFVILQSFVEQK